MPIRTRTSEETENPRKSLFYAFFGGFNSGEDFFYCIKISRNIDPPYNAGNEGWVYNDNVNDPKIKKRLGEVVGKEGEDLTRHDKRLCMMYPRLKLLADDGVIFISIDDIEVTYLRLIMDEIFGKTNFIAQLIWKSRQNKDTATSASTRSTVC